MIETWRHVPCRWVVTFSHWCVFESNNVLEKGFNVECEWRTTPPKGYVWVLE